MEELENQKKEPLPEEQPPAGKKDGENIENFITSNSNGNGINPNPTESGNDPEWEPGIESNTTYKDDSGLPD